MKIFLNNIIIYCIGYILVKEYNCDVIMGKQEAIWVNAIAFLGCMFSVPFAGINYNTEYMKVAI